MEEVLLLASALLDFSVFLMQFSQVIPNAALICWRVTDSANLQISGTNTLTLYVIPALLGFKRVFDLGPNFVGTIVTLNTRAHSKNFSGNVVDDRLSQCFSLHISTQGILSDLPQRLESETLLYIMFVHVPPTWLVQN